MKNCFGITPTTIYGQGAGLDEPSVEAVGPRDMLHSGKRQPSRSALPELDPNSPSDPGYRVPRVTVDLVAARPIHLSIIDGIETVAGGEGPWVRSMRTVSPGLLIAGTNCVTTDAVCAALMGFDPMSDRGTAPFENCDNTLKLAEERGHWDTRPEAHRSTPAFPSRKAGSNFGRRKYPLHFRIRAQAARSAVLLRQTITYSSDTARKFIETEGFKRSIVGFEAKQSTLEIY